jgi:hypothetical protein
MGLVLQLADLVSNAMRSMRQIAPTFPIIDARIFGTPILVRA